MYSFYKQFYPQQNSITSTSNPNYMTESSSRLSKQDIVEILESPYETNYTYSETLSYNQNGSSEYIHPRLCRIFHYSPTKFNKIEQQNIFIWIFLQIAKFASLTCSALYFYLYMFFDYALKPVYGIGYRFQNYWNEIKYVWLNSESYWHFTRSLFYAIIFREFNDYSTIKQQRFTKQKNNKHCHLIKTLNFTLLKFLIFLSILYLIYLFSQKCKENENQDEFDKIYPLKNQKSNFVHPFCTIKNISNEHSFQTNTKEYLFISSENIINNTKINIYYGTIHDIVDENIKENLSKIIKANITENIIKPTTNKIFNKTMFDNSNKHFGICRWEKKISTNEIIHLNKTNLQKSKISTNLSSLSKNNLIISKINIKITFRFCKIRIDINFLKHLLLDNYDDKKCLKFSLIPKSFYWGIFPFFGKN